MSIIDFFQSFQTQEQSIDYLEKVRWGSEPHCPYCGSTAVGPHASGDRKIARWQCRDCTRAFAVTVGTLFHGTHIPLRNWFLVLALMLNAKKPASAYQIARDLGIRRPTVWSMMHRIRAAMADDPEQDRLLHLIVEADEVHLGGKPRKGNKRGDDTKNQLGRGNSKVPIVDSIERGGRDVATQTKTIERFWAIVKRAWYSSHHHYSRKYMPLYVAGAYFKYNRRKSATVLGQDVRIFVGAMA